jgi:hypothetical protein
MALPTYIRNRTCKDNKTMAIKNSCGPDLPTNTMLKKEMYAFSKLLKPLINESITQGIFPVVLKEANVIPV